jgi:hypothetical protein
MASDSGPYDAVVIGGGELFLLVCLFYGSLMPFAQDLAVTSLQLRLLSTVSRYVVIYFNHTNLMTKEYHSLGRLFALKSEGHSAEHVSTLAVFHRKLC